ncbi:MAG: carotenoid oxygenase family protein [Chloroflexaceae bacterium]|nr:carotenoid oxygenase family protein [Chloroflexaceae bacterium]
MTAKGFQQGFTSLNRETHYEALPVRGSIPPWLSGTLIRNGPAKFDVGSETVHHWFDGFAMLHAFTFRHGAVAYTNRFLRSKSYSEAARTGKLSFSAFAADPCRVIFSRFFSVLFAHADNANVNIARIADRFVALTETPLPIEFNPRTLETIGPFVYDDRLAGSLTSAHPLYDPTNNAAINYTLRFNIVSSYHVYMTRGRRRKRIGVLPVAEPAYMHSFAATTRYVILAEFPFMVHPVKFLLTGKPFIENFRWRPERGTRFLVFDKECQEPMQVYESEAFFSFHHVNAYENDAGLVLDCVAYPDPSIIHQLYLHRVREAEQMPTGILRRYHLPRNGGKVRSEQLASAGLELPQINESQARSRPYRFAYGVGADQPINFLNHLVKVDVERGERQVWSEAGCFPGEPVFVPTPGGQREDDGVLLSVVLDAERGTSFLLVLDAASFTELGRAEVPHHIPFGFHGFFFNDV